MNPVKNLLEDQQKALGDNYNKTILTLKEFRQALSFSLDRAAFALAAAPYCINPVVLQKFNTLGLEISCIVHTDFDLNGIIFSHQAPLNSKIISLVKEFLFALAAAPTNTAAFGMFSDLIIYDPDNGSTYRSTDEAIVLGIPAGVVTKSIFRGVNLHQVIGIQGRAGESNAEEHVYTAMRSARVRCMRIWTRPLPASPAIT
mgnify:CR=1 FL=1